MSSASEHRSGAEERSSDKHGWVLPVAVAVARRPRLWPAAVVQARRLARPGWWRRPPFLPVPAPEWLAFRARTAYGDPDHPPEPADVVAWLEWCGGSR